LVLEEIPRIRKDLGLIPLVTPTSQIVGTQAVINVLMGERYKTISKEVQGILRGEYGAAPAPFDEALQQRVLNGAEAITCRPADLIASEMNQLTTELEQIAAQKGIQLAGENKVDDVLIYALFPQVGLKFLENRNNPDAFEPIPTIEEATTMAAKNTGPQVYTISVNGQNYVVQVAEGGDVSSIAPSKAPAQAAAAPVAASDGEEIPAPLAGNIWKVEVEVGDTVEEGDVIIILEAMKMETEVRAARSGRVVSVDVKEGDSVQVGDSLISLA
jgi:oxaloacetate decarboxylase alpha subunit